MSRGIRNPTTDFWYVAYTARNDTFHFGEMNTGNELVTGQETLERFRTEDDLGARIDELKGIPNWYEDNK